MSNDDQPRLTACFELNMTSAMAHAMSVDPHLSTIIAARVRVLDAEQRIRAELTPILGSPQVERAILLGRDTHDMDGVRERLMRGDTLDDAGRWYVYTPMSSEQLAAIAAVLRSFSVGFRVPKSFALAPDRQESTAATAPCDPKTKHGRAPRSTKPDRNARARAKVLAKGST
jgi:hypothetical protein